MFRVRINGSVFFSVERAYVSQGLIELLSGAPVFSNRMGGKVNWQLHAQIKQLAWPMTERQIGHRKSSLVLSARFSCVKWRSRSFGKSA